MRIILIPENTGKRQHTTLTATQVSVLLFLMIVAIPVLVGWGTWTLASREFSTSTQPVRIESLVQLQHEIDSERENIEEIRRASKKNLDFLGLQLGQLQAQAARINAVGRRLAGVAGLDDGEFDFSIDPALGGARAGRSGGENGLSRPD